MFRIGRTLSTADRTNDDAIAKEQFLTNKRNEITNMLNNGTLSEAQADIMGTAINHYVQFNGGNTKRGFELGLTELIENQLRDFLEPDNLEFGRLNISN